MSLFFLVLATCVLEHRTLVRRPVDFSAGFVFPMLLAVAGLPIEAGILVLAALFLRQLQGVASYPWDLVALVPGLLLLGFVRFTDRPDLFWAVSAVALSALFMHGVSVWSRRSLAQDWLARATEQQFSVARLILLPLCLLGVLVSQESLWTTVMLLPALYLALKFSGDLGFRLEAQAGQRAREEAAESRSSLVEAQSQLRSLSEKQHMVEKLVRVFKEPLGPREAFSQLRKITASVIPYDSLFFLKVNAQGEVQVQDRFCVHDRWSRESRLGLSREPLVEKAWTTDRAIKGQAGRALVSTDNHAVVIPLKPLGVLYFGRRSEAFSKEEAGRLRFVAERAEGGLKRAQERAEFTQALAEEKRVSRQLQYQVTLSSHLLAAAQKILSAPTEQAVFETLIGSTSEAIEHRWGAVLSAEKPEPVVQWGNGPELSAQDRSHFLSLESVGVARQIGPDLVYSYPVKGEAESLGAMLIGCEQAGRLSGEEEDFLGTLACLVAGGLEALRLNQKLQQAHQHVLQAAKLSAIGRLAAGVAHELNSPLAAIGLALESAMIRPEKAGEKLEKASGALERARKIVNDLLQHSRTTGSKRVVVHLAAVFEGLMEVVSAQLEQRHLKFSKVCRNPEAGILINKAELNQVLINLVLNAADASEEGQEIQVAAFAEELKVIIEVRDQGAGIPDENKNRVFDPFFTTKSVGRGTGLGLSVCRELVLRHQGEISFQSKVGSGTTFRLVFPRQDTWP